jgi:hypothetical protein
VLPLLNAEPAWPVGAEHDVIGPGRQRPRHRKAAASPAIYAEPAAAELPAVAVRTLEHAGAEQFEESVDRGQLVLHAGGDEQLACMCLFAADLHAESLAGWHSSRHLCTSAGHGRIGRQFGTCEFREICGGNAITRDEAMHGL